MITIKHSTELGGIWSQWTPSGLFRIALACPEDAIAETAKGQSTTIEQFDNLLRSFCETGQGDFTEILLDESNWTPFTHRVYECCRKIPPGQTLTYKQLATEAGSPKASRAVGAAMSRNRILLVIPCHRVLASNGQLRGFSAPGGVSTKRKLLDLEQRDQLQNFALSTR